MKPDTRSYYAQAVLVAAERIVRTLDDALDLEELAGVVHLSPFHFHPIFRGMLGETPLELHRRLRLERAALALCTGNQPVTRVAFEAGYETHEAFTRAFRARYGSAPSAFRQRAGETDGSCVRTAQIEIAARSGIHYSPGSTGRLSLPLLVEGSLMDVTVVTRPTLRVAACRHTGAYNRISEAFARLHALAGPAGLLREGAMMLAVYHDDPEITPEAQLRSDAGLTIPPDVPVPEGLTEETITGGLYALTTHIGPYETLGDTWSRLMGEWLPRSAYRLGDGVSHEIYRNTPMDTPPEQLRTELLIPVVAEASVTSRV